MQTQAMRHLTDLNLAAYLMARGFKLTSLRGRGSQLAFQFAAVPDTAIYSFYNGDDSVSARVLLDALRNLKGLIRQGWDEDEVDRARR